MGWTSPLVTASMCQSGSADQPLEPRDIQFHRAGSLRTGSLNASMGARSIEATRRVSDFHWHTVPRLCTLVGDRQHPSLHFPDRTSVSRPISSVGRLDQCARRRIITNGEGVVDTRRFTQGAGARYSAVRTSPEHGLAGFVCANFASEDDALPQPAADASSRTLTANRAAQFASTSVSVRFLRLRPLNRSPPLNRSEHVP